MVYVSAINEPVLIEIPKKVKRLNLQRVSTSGVIIDNLTLDDLYLTNKSNDNHSAIKVQNCDLGKLDADYGMGKLHVKNSKISKEMSYKSENINQILIENTKLKEMKTDCSPNTVVLFKKMNIKTISIGSANYVYNKKGINIRIDNKREALERNFGYKSIVWG